MCDELQSNNLAHKGGGCEGELFFMVWGLVKKWWLGLGATWQTPNIGLSSYDTANS
jgi:hypothetical protein